MFDKIVIAIDFDGTITTQNCFPDIGEFRPYAIEAIKKLQEKGCKCFLWTCREGKELEAAKQALENAGLVLDGYNVSPLDYLNPSSRKPIATIYIDDRGFPVPYDFDYVLDWQYIYKCITGEFLLKEDIEEVIRRC